MPCRRWSLVGGNCSGTDQSGRGVAWLAMVTRARAWFAARTTTATDWPLEQLLIRKASRPTRISVIVPARNEQATIGAIVRRIRADLMDAVALVDELVVIDSDSTDATARVARSEGAQVWAAAEVRPELGAYRGQGRGSVEGPVRRDRRPPRLPRRRPDRVGLAFRHRPGRTVARRRAVAAGQGLLRPAFRRRQRRSG